MPTIDLTKLLKLLLNPKSWLYILGLVVVLVVAYKGYNWVYDRGAAAKEKELIALVNSKEAERKEAVDNYNRYKGEYDAWVGNTKKAQEQYLKEQLADLAERQRRLEEAEKAARNKPTTIKEVIKYVPAEVDATYRLPVGLVRLYGETLQGQPAPGSSAELSGGNAINVGAPSGLAVSQFGYIAAFNNAECVVRGEVIAEWQDWYRVNKAKFDKIQAEQKANGPTP
ncbi:hypothetical protein LUCX_190 [Xanthomonas phage vB_XciM_LucasX]|nr:hypothetical protein LUCX_190 [Xanthomonas phage vB_XciM_LucasX]